MSILTRLIFIVGISVTLCSGAEIENIPPHPRAENPRALPATDDGVANLRFEIRTTHLANDVFEFYDQHFQQPDWVPCGDTSNVMWRRVDSQLAGTRRSSNTAFLAWKSSDDDELVVVFVDDPSVSDCDSDSASTTQSVTVMLVKGRAQVAGTMRMLSVSCPRVE